ILQTCKRPKFESHSELIEPNSSSLVTLFRFGLSGHSLQYFDTTVSVPGHGLPQFISVCYVDGIEITRYSSDVGRAVPVAPWMKKLEDPDYWKRNTQLYKGNKAGYKQGMKILMNSFNHTRGFHIGQRMFGCELRGDGSTRGYDQFGYDGKDHMVLDPERWVYYALVDQAQVTTQKWNSPEERAGERSKNYMENICIPWLRKYLVYGEEELERRVHPEVKVSDQNVNGVTKLHCQVYGFYPRDVDVKWEKNGIDVLSYEAKHVLPNSDGTYQIRVTVEVAAEDREGHSFLLTMLHHSHTKLCGRCGRGALRTSVLAVLRSCLTCVRLPRPLCVRSSVRTYFMCRLQWTFFHAITDVLLGAITDVNTTLV
uniref:Ig-like domain-containing protein n=1 Tax=Leptobrachium leishanense TaxID=445787 RepID=A0A8C5PYZ9_9ANUR